MTDLNIVLYTYKGCERVRVTATEDGACEGCGKGVVEKLSLCKVLERYFIRMEIFFTGLSRVKKCLRQHNYDFFFFFFLKEFMTGSVEMGCRTCPVLVETFFSLHSQDPFCAPES